MKRLNIIGGGSVGAVLGRLWHDASALEIGDVLNRSEASAQCAVNFIGGGRVIGHIEELNPSDLYLIGTPDDVIGEIDQQLAASGALRPGDLVFHCSGALPAAHLINSATAGALIASVHPIKSFAAPERVVESFEGTFCGIEGSPDGVEILGKLVTAIGGELLPIDSSAKTLYHGASVFVCNYLTALMEIGLRTFGAAGIERETACRAMAPMIRNTIENVLLDGTVSALTGPIARGDIRTVSRQLAEISEWNPGVGDLYRILGRVAVELSEKKGAASKSSLEAIQTLLVERNRFA